MLISTRWRRRKLTRKSILSKDGPCSARRSSSRNPFTLQGEIYAIALATCPNVTTHTTSTVRWCSGCTPTPSCSSSSPPSLLSSSFLVAPCCLHCGREERKGESKEAYICAASPDEVGALLQRRAIECARSGSEEECPGKTHESSAMAENNKRNSVAGKVATPKTTGPSTAQAMVDTLETLGKAVGAR